MWDLKSKTVKKWQSNAGVMFEYDSNELPAMAYKRPIQVKEQCV